MRVCKGHKETQGTQGDTRDTEDSMSAVRGYLHQRGEKHKRSTIGNHVKDEHGN